MDWNSFFNSLAQSVAALVGVFAAFIITKIINNQSTFAQKVARTKEILSLSEKHKEVAKNRYFWWYNERRMEDAIKELRELLLKEPVKTAEEYYELIRFPVYEPRSDVINKINEILPPSVYHSEPDKSFDDSEPDKSTTHNSHQEFFNPSWQITRSAESLREQRDSQRRLQESVQEEGEKISDLLSEIRQHVRLVRRQIADIEDNPESSTLISVSIAGALLLFFVGVIYPLGLLPYSPNQSLSIGAFFSVLYSLKGALLTTVAMIFSLMMIIFFRVNSSLRYSGEELNKLRQASEVGYYSKYFEIRVNNASELKAWLQASNQKSESETSTENLND